MKRNSLLYGGTYAVEPATAATGLTLESFRAAKAALSPTAWYGVSESVDAGKIFIIIKPTGPVPYPDIFVVHPDTLPELERHAAENNILLRPVSEWRLGMHWLALQS